MDASLAANTKDTYRLGLQSFESFREEFKLNTIWPPPHSHVLLFVAYLSLMGKSHRTASCYVSAIGFRCKVLQSMPCNYSQSFVVKKMLEGMKRLKGTKDVRLPITLELLTNIIDKLPSVCFSAYEALLFAAAFSLAFHGFLRIGEIVYTKAGQVRQIICVQDVKLHSLKNQQSIRIHITHSKSDQTGQGLFIDIIETGTKICPVRLLKCYLKERPNTSGPLFCHFNGKHVSRFQFSSVLNKALKVNGIKLYGYKSHSFRIGAATAASARGASDEEIMKLGRWKSNAFRSYIRL